MRPSLTTTPKGTQLFLDLVETGRAFTGTPNEGMLRLGPPRTGTVFWTCLEDGSQSLAVRLVPEDAQQELTPVVPLPPGSPYYLDLQTRVVGPLKTPLPDATVVALATSPVLDPRAVMSLTEESLDQLEQLGLPLPHVQQWVEPDGFGFEFVVVLRSLAH